MPKFRCSNNLGHPTVDVEIPDEKHQAKAAGDEKATHAKEQAALVAKSRWGLDGIGCDVKVEEVHDTKPDDSAHNKRTVKSETTVKAEQTEGKGIDDSVSDFLEEQNAEPQTPSDRANVTATKAMTTRERNQAERAEKAKAKKGNAAGGAKGKKK